MRAAGACKTYPPAAAGDSDTCLLRRRVLRFAPPRQLNRLTAFFSMATIGSCLQAFMSWVTAQPDIEGVALVGSHARGTATEDSDVDLILLTSDPTRYLAKQDWLSLCGDVERSVNEQWGGVQTVRTFYKAGLEIEYNFAAPSWAQIPIDDGTRMVVNDGLKILFDPNGMLDALQKATIAESR